MRQRDLGELRVSVVGLGCSKLGAQVDLAGTRAIVAAALDAGVNFFDTADVYGGGAGPSEQLLGEALGDRRDDAVLATKFGMNRAAADGEPEAAPGSRASMRRAVESSLRRLQTDRIDLLQYHLPDGVTPIEETLGALDELVGEGSVRCFGCSNFSAAQLAEAADASRSHGFASFVSLQNRYSLLERGIEADVVPECARLGVGVIPYFPLASGLLTGKYRRGDAVLEGLRAHLGGEQGDAAVFDRLDALSKFAAARDLEPVQVAIGGLAEQPMVASVIAGATSARQVRANAAAALWEPTADELAELDQIFPAGPDAGVEPRVRSRREWLARLAPWRGRLPGRS